MKKYVLAAMISLSLVSASAFAEEKSVNVRVNPVGLLIGYVSADVELLSLSDGFTVGPTLGYFSLDLSGTKTSYYSFGVRGNMYLNGKKFTDGWFLGPLVQFAPTSYKYTLGTTEYSASASALSFGAIFGYHWMWDGGFNMNLGLGAGYSTASSSATLTSSGGQTVTQSVSGGGVGPMIEFSLGYAF